MAEIKVINSLLKGTVAKVIYRVVNSDLPGKAACLTGYLTILVGAIMTFLVRSSSVFTSTMTPLVGIGIISVPRMYPLTLGANIGTTFNSMIAAFTADANEIQNTLQVSLCHLFFNITGILIFYPVPVMRGLPIKLAKGLGNTTARYRWVPVIYLLLVFFLLPGMVFALSLAGWYVLLAVGAPIALLAALIVIINIIQDRCPSRLPVKYRTWMWLPEPLRTLAPYNRTLRACCGPCCSKLCAQGQEVESEEDHVIYMVPDAILQENSDPSSLAQVLGIHQHKGATTTGSSIDVSSIGVDNRAFDTRL